MIHTHSHPLEPPKPTLDPDKAVRQSELAPPFRPLELLNYRIHIGWFGGIRIYSIADIGD